MKLWLPWRRRKALPHPKSAAGPFYVVNHECMFCGFPHEVAPDLMAWHEDESGHCHCYFKRQPETRGELDRAIKAINTSCCGALVYSGNDANVLDELRRSGSHKAIVDKG